MGQFAFKGVIRTSGPVSLYYDAQRVLHAGRVRVQGAIHLSLRRFGVKPPTALFGLIRVQDSVTVAADLVGKPGCPDAQ